MARAGLTLRLAALTFVLVAAPLAAGAQEYGPSADAQYATLLRTINPHLQVHESLRYARSILADAHRSNLDPRLIMALVTVESSWRPDAISHSGARGLGQLMPTTAKTLGVTNSWDPGQNLRGAATYLRAMLNRFAGRGDHTFSYAIGAYNAGPHAVEKYGGIPPYQETQTYVRRVLAMWQTIRGRVGRALNAGPPAAAVADDSRIWLANTTASALADDAVTH